MPRALLEREQRGVPSALPRQPPALTPASSQEAVWFGYSFVEVRPGSGYFFFPLCLGNGLQTALSMGELVACERGFSAPSLLDLR